MLAAMHEKTRYNLRLAEKRGVSVRFSSDPSDASILYGLLAKTGERAGIRLHDPSYYRKMMETLGAKGGFSTTLEQYSSTRIDAVSGESGGEARLRVEIAIAERLGHPVAAALVAHYGDRAIYLHGGSDYEQRNLMAPHLLHWAVMQRAAGAGQAVYDLGGIAPDDAPNHPWAGISRFKRGFGGTPIDYPPAVDVVVNRGMYQLYQFGRRLNRSLH